jgi:flagellar protein FliS
MGYKDMQATTGYSAYRTSAAQIAKPKDEILLMLYDGALQFLRFASTSLEQRNLAAKGQYISKTLAIIGELDCALDRHIGGEIAGNLSDLYQYMITRLIQANCQNDAAALDEVGTLLHELQQAFATAVQQQRATVSIPATTSQAPASKGLNVAV